MKYVSKCQWTWNDFKGEPGKPVPSDVPEGVIAAQLSLGHIASIPPEPGEPVTSTMPEDIVADQSSQAPTTNVQADTPEAQAKQEG